MRRNLESPKLNAFTFQVGNQAADAVIESFCQWLEAYIRGGAEIENGQTLQVGYTLIRCAVDENTLLLESPDFTLMPIQWNADMTSAIQMLGWHRYVPESFSLDSDIPTLLQTAMVGQKYDRLPMFGTRLEPTGPNDSGWFFGSTLDDVNNNDPDQLATMSLYEAMISIPQMTPYLSMPKDTQVIFATKTPDILMNDAKLEAASGSFIEMMNENK